MQAGVYVRISQDKSGERAGVQRQLADCLAFCEGRGWAVAGVYEDNDMSAFSGRSRPQYERLMDDLRAGRVGAVVCWHPDRLHRRPVELEAFIDVIETTGATVATCTAGDYDLATPEGRLTARITGSVARKESEDKSRRLRRKSDDMAEKGEWHGGTRAFGYQADGLTIDRQEAVLIRDAANTILRGGSPRSVALAWNRQGVPTPRGNGWVPQVVRNLLLSPRLAGLRQHRGEVVGEAAWEPIIDVRTHERLKAILTHPKRNTRGIVTARKHTLAGFLRCGICGEVLKSAVSNGAPAYSCKVGGSPKACGKLAVKAEPVEQFIKQTVIRRIVESPAVGRSTAELDRNDVILDEISELRDRIADLEEERYVTGSISKASYNRLRHQLDERSEGLYGKLAQVTGNDALDGVERNADILEAKWEDPDSLEFRRGLIAAFIESIVMLPAPHKGARFDPSRVQVQFRAV